MDMKKLVIPVLSVLVILAIALPAAAWWGPWGWGGLWGPWGWGGCGCGLGFGGFWGPWW